VVDRFCMKEAARTNVQAIGEAPQVVLHGPVGTARLRSAPWMDRKTTLLGAPVTRMVIAAHRRPNVK
jgi:hypothetical protein